MIRFDDLHDTLTTKKYVPLVGDVMISRWSYEALAVAQFKNNQFERHFFDVEKDMSHYSFQNAYRIPRIESMVNGLKLSSDFKGKEWQFVVLKNELNKISDETRAFGLINAIDTISFNATVADRTIAYLERRKVDYQDLYKAAVDQKDSIYNGLVKELGKDGVFNLKVDHFNKSLSDIVTNRSELNKVYRTREEFIQKKDPIYKEPVSRLLRAHFYAPVKNLFGFKIDTVWFNVIVIWLITGILYFTLLGDSLKKLLKFFSRDGRKKKANLLRV